MELKLREDRVKANFFDLDHRYEDQNGNHYVSVTQAMSLLMEKRYRFVPRETLEYAAQRGTAVHACAEYDDYGDLDESSVDSEWWPYLEAWRSFKKDFKPEIIFNELRLINPVRKYAGAVDRVVKIKNDYWIIDLKTTATLFEEVGIQLAAYEKLLKENIENPSKIVFKRAAVQLKSDGSYFFHECKSKDDYSAFESCLTLFNWAKNHGINYFSK